MVTSKRQEKKQPSAKEKMTIQVTELLKPVKEILKKELGDKKTDKRIKKAVKLIIHGIKHDNSEKKPVKKAPVKKSSKKKSIPVPAKKSLLAKKTKL